MNLLCPNCQKMLTVPEQYAGQMMKCPLCAGTFTVPGLPAAASTPPPPPPETYPLQTDPLPPPPPPPPPPSSYPVPPPSPGFAPPPVSKPVSSGPPWTLPPPPPPAGDYTTTRSAWLSPKVLVWIPAPALLLIFILSFFPWVGIYPGGVPAVTQTLWGAAFGGYTDDPDMKTSFPMHTDTELAKEKEAVDAERKAAKDSGNKFDEDKHKVYDNRPSWSPSLVFYVFLFLITLLVTAAVTVLAVAPFPLPPAIHPLLPLRWAIVAGLNLLVFLLLSLSLLFGFNLENKYADYSQAKLAQTKAAIGGNVPKALLEAAEGTQAAADRLTLVLKVVVFLHLLVIVVAFLMFWLNQRERIGRPMPRFDLKL